ncbi:hypothetical protein [Kribbella sp. NPDC049584]|uniref:hypothetical protein n=1 Tax=Kribbella sp. NPDC049584 TaxID=3154833 RepID=UPI0034355FA7
MNTELEPPRVPPLTPAERSRLRNQVMDRSRPTEHRPARRWIAPAIAVGAVAAAVAGTLVITNRAPSDPGVAGTPPAATPTMVRAGLPVVPDAEAVAAFTKSCERRMQTKLVRPLRVAWARRVPAANPNATDILVVVIGAAASGVATCVAPAGAGGWRQWDPSALSVPTKKQGLVGVSGGIAGGTAGSTPSRMWTLYRARPEIARIESRLVSKGTASSWQAGYLDDGYAYVDNRVAAAIDVMGVQQEVRAYDAQGRPVPVEQKTK